jgi:hypothetical protein
VFGADSLSFAVHVDFTSTISVSIGQELALVYFLTSTPPNGEPTLLGAQSDMAAYPGGRVFVYSLFDQSWLQLGLAGGDDFYFRTYVARYS